MKIVNLDAITLGDADFSELNNFGEYISYDLTRYEETLEQCKGAEIVLTNKVVLDKAILSQLEALKLICVTATGTNIVDVEFASQRGIIVKNVAGYSTLSVAQHTITMVLEFLSQLHYYDTYCKSGQWSQSPTFTHLAGGRVSIDSKKWGIIGFGSIGQRVAQIATCLGAKVCYTSTSGKNQNTSYPQVSLENLLKECDIISIHAPLNPATKNLINAKSLALLKPNAILINVGRGGIVNEEDVTVALKNGARFFYGCDVLEVEPMRKNHPFLDSSIQDRLLITPHIAYAYGDSLKNLIALSIDNVKTFIKTGK